MSNPITLTTDEEEWLLQMQKETHSQTGCGCGGTGFTLVMDGTLQKAKLCVCATDKLRYEKYTESGIERIYHKFSMDNWSLHQDANGEELSALDKSNKSHIGRFVTTYINALPALCAGIPLTLKQSKGKGTNKKVMSLALIGGEKSGKSMLASVIAMKAVDAGLSVRYYNWLNLVDVLKAFEYQEEQTKLVKEASTVDFVVVDGVSEYNIPPHCFKFQLDRFASSRLNSGKPIVFTWNRPVEDRNFSLNIANTGYTWKNLVDSCLKINLPSLQK